MCTDSGGDEVVLPIVFRHEDEFVGPVFGKKDECCTFPTRCKRRTGMAHGKCERSKVGGGDK